MEIREINVSEKNQYNQTVSHPLQSWEWGEFRKATGVKVVRLGHFLGKKLKFAYQVTFHKLPHLAFTIGYFPKGPLPTQEMIVALKKIGQENNALFIQLEPDVILGRSETTTPESVPVSDSGRARSSLTRMTSLIPSSRPIFTKYTFHIDLTISEEELMKNMSSKTRYNVHVAQKHGVTIQEENTKEAFHRYLELTQETTHRQGFYAHSETYHKLMWQALNQQSIAHLLTARYQGEILVTWIIFLFNNVLYYPYGASSSENKQVMASNLMMWEAIRWGKNQGAKLFDLWGTPGPDPKPTDPYFGFHRFKLGYGPKLVEFIGSYNLILKQPHYILYTIADKLRWILLRLKTKF